MPNWCHCILTVSGDPADVDEFVARARPSEAHLLREYEEALAEAAAYAVSEAPASYEDYVREHSRPLSFNSHAPEPDALGLLRLEERIRCFCCGGTGRRERSDVRRFVGASAAGGEDEAVEDWYASTGGCNGCGGDGQRVREPGWLVHHVAAWGTKWDASFGGAPWIAIGTTEDADPDASADANGIYQVPGTAVYRFDTAWSPPEPWLATAAAAHPSLRLELRWGEPGSETAGITAYVDGTLAEQRDLPLEDVLTPEEMWF